jgi:uncharacterized protein
MKIAHIVLLVMLAFGQGFAEETGTKTAVAEKLVDLFHMEKMYDQLLDQMKNSDIAMMEAMFEEKGASEEILKSYRESAEQTLNVVKKSFPWEKMKSMLVKAHAEVYTVEEMKALADFYKTPIGQKCIEKQPQLSASIMQNAQKFMMEMMPKIQKELQVVKDKYKKELEEEKK